MLHRLCHNIDNNFEQFLAGAGIIAIGVSLWIDRKYFFWPPELTQAMNDQRLDLIITILGFGLLVMAITGNRSKAWEQIFLILCGSVICMLAFTQIWHANLAGQTQMAHSVIGDVLIFILIIRAAWKS